LKKGSPRSPSFKMNLFRAAMHPVFNLVESLCEIPYG
jgi:hypothetical protein